MTLTTTDHISTGHYLAVLHHVLFQLRARLDQRYPRTHAMFRVFEKTTHALTGLCEALNRDAQRHYQEATDDWYFGVTALEAWPDLPDQPVAPKRLKPRMTTAERVFVLALLRTRINDFNALDATLRRHYDHGSHIDQAALKCSAFLAKLAEAIAAAEVRA